MIGKFALICATVTTLFAQKAYPPGAIHLTPEIDLQLRPVPLVVPERFRDEIPDDLTVNLPPGFSASVFAATGLRGPRLMARGPRLMAWSPDGVLHVANMQVANPADVENLRRKNQSFGQIVALPDLNRDGVADTAVVVAGGLRWINSLAFFEGHLYSADIHQIVRFSDTDLDGIYEARQTLASLPECGHYTRTVVVDEVNRKLYVSVGSTHDLSREEEPECAAVLQFDLDGSGRRIFARGLRNAVGLAFHPLTNELWATNNGHDLEGPILPPEMIDIVRDGGFYGFPFAYGYQVSVDFSIRPYARDILPMSRQDSLDVRSMQRPAVLIPAHLAPMGIHFYAGDAFPDSYRGAAFVAVRAGFRAAVTGYKLIVLFELGEGASTRVADFLTGFQPVVGSDEGVWGHPVGVLSDEEGSSLYVTSDVSTHLIIKVTYEPGG